MIAIYYLYFRIYRLIEAINLKSSYYQGRVAFFFSIVTGCNLVTILHVLGINAFNHNYVLILIALIWFIFWLKFFAKPGRLAKVLAQFDNETLFHKILGGLGVIIYIIGSFVIFIKAMTA